MDLATRLKSFLTPDQIEKLTRALTNIENRQRIPPTPPKSSEPEKVITLEPVDAISEGEKRIVEMVNEWDKIPVASSTHDDFLFDAIVELKREVAELRKARQ